MFTAGPKNSLVRGKGRLCKVMSAMVMQCESSTDCFEILSQSQAMPICVSLLVASPERWKHGTPVFRRDFGTETTNTMCAELVRVVIIITFIILLFYAQGNVPCLSKEVLSVCRQSGWPVPVQKIGQLKFLKWKEKKKCEKMDLNLASRKKTKTKQHSLSGNYSLRAYEKDML